MTRSKLDTLLASILDAFPPLSPAERRAGLSLYALLAGGRPVRPETLAAKLNLPSREIVALLAKPGLRSQILFDDEGAVIGFGGLSVVPAAHGMLLDGVNLFTWCAWDTLFIPALLGRDAAISSKCPASGVDISITVREHGVEHADGIALSFVIPKASECTTSTERAIACFCDEVRFYGSADLAREWTVTRDNAHILSIDDGWWLGRRYNAARFPNAPPRNAKAVADNQVAHEA